MKREIRLIVVAGMLIGMFGLAAGCSSGDKSPTSKSNTSPLLGCDFGATCTTPQQFCFNDPNNPGTSGKLWCDTATHKLTSFCQAGNYCSQTDTPGLWPGCTDQRAVALVCSNNMLVPAPAADAGPDGAAGAAGAGSGGTAGAAGSSGTAGQGGQAGASGAAGSSGSAGAAGTGGTAGASGSGGTAGAAGAGTGGTAGAAGAGTGGTAGQGGQAGASGAAGSSGSAGAAGAGTGGTAGASGSGGTAGAGTGGTSGAAGSSGSAGAAGSGNNACTPKPDVPCVVDAYGCLPSNVSFCVNNENPAVPLILQCLCPDANGYGTWLLSGTQCGSANLCWSGDAGSTGGTAGTSGSGGSAGSATGGTAGTSTGGSSGSAGMAGAAGTGGTAGAAGAGTGGTAGMAGSGGSAGSADAGVDASGSGGSAGSATGGSSGSSSDGGVKTLVFTWSPDTATVDGPVTVEGWYLEPGGIAHNWGTLCTASSVDGVYTCSTVIPSGSYLAFNMRYVNNAVQGGFCWTFDKSTNVPCGGSGSFIGSVVVTENGAPVSGSMVWNNTGPAPPNEVFYNMEIQPVP